jgi:hypothetical protein
MREKKDFINEDEKIEYNLRKLISALKLSENVKNIFYQEFDEKVQTYSKRKDIFDFISRII